MRKLDEVAAVQRQFDNFAGIDNRPYRGVLRLQQYRGGHYINCLGHVADLQSEVDAGGLIDLQVDGIDLLRLEALVSCYDQVIAGRQKRH